MERINNISRQRWQAESNCAMAHTNVMILDPKQYTHSPGDLITI